MKNKNSSSSLTKWMVILPLFGIAITALALIKIFLNYETDVYNESIFEIRKDVIKQSKINAYDRVFEIENHIKTSEKILKQESEEEVKSMVNIAFGLIDSIYKNSKNLPKKEIKTRVIKYLRDVRFFNNNSGYFFIYDMNGTCLLLPPMPDLENTNLLNIKDAKGNFTIKEHLKIIEKSKEGFYEWYWYKLGSKEMKKKIGFVKAYENLGIYVGTARYEEDILENVKKEVQEQLIDIRYEDKGYIFAFDYSGNTISDIKKDLIGVNRWNVVSDNEHIIKNFINGTRLLEEGSFMTYLDTPNSKTGKKAYKTSFVKDIPEIGWVIGTGAYYNDVLSKVEFKRKKLREKFSDVVKKIGYATSLVLIIMFIITLIISFKLHNILKNYQKSLLIKNKQSIKQKEQLVYQLEHDHLTQLPNRILLMERLNQSINQSKRDQREIAVMFIDIDKFKDINDTLGHDVGDIILKETAKRLENSIRKSDIVARFGGDEFIIIVDNYKNIQDIITIIGKIQKSVKDPIYLGESEYKTTLSIGISIFPEDGEDPSLLLKNADIAMYRAKDSGRDGYRFFTKHMDEEIQTRMKIENSLAIACKKREFVLYYQPVIDAISGKIVGAEALIRWQHPTRGLIYPDDFIPIAEESNLIVSIGEWVIDEAMRQIVEWKTKGYGIEKVAINLATRQLENNNLLEYIEQSLKRTSCKAKWIEFEVIERYVMKDIKKSIKTLKVLRQMGIDVAIDDFGTGYSSLAYLKNLPITKLKIDRAFVKNLDNSFEDRAIAKTIIALGNGLLMKVLAEGVETKEQKSFLSKQSCSLMQGYLFSKPLSCQDIEAHLKRGSF